MAGCGLYMIEPLDTDDVDVIEPDISTLSREELEAEVRRLRGTAGDAPTAHASDKPRIRAIFDSITDFAIVVTDRAGRVTEWNSGAEHVLGWSAAEMLGEPAARFFTPQDRAAAIVEAEMRHALRDGRASDERWHLKNDGITVLGVGRDDAAAGSGAGEHLRLRQGPTRSHGRCTSGHAAHWNRPSRRGCVRRRKRAASGCSPSTSPDDVLMPTPEFCRLFVRFTDPVAIILPATFQDADCRRRSAISSRPQASPQPAARRLREIEYRIRLRPIPASCAGSRARGRSNWTPSGRPIRFVGVARNVTAQRLGRRRARPQRGTLSRAVRSDRRRLLHYRVLRRTARAAQRLCPCRGQ